MASSGAIVSQSSINGKTMYDVDKSVESPGMKQPSTTQAQTIHLVKSIDKEGLKPNNRGQSMRVTSNSASGKQSIQAMSK